MIDARPPRTTAHASIADCARCAGLPPKLIASATDGDEPVVPAAADELAIVVVVDSARLLQCPTCATHYYFQREHQEREICSRESTDVTLRRQGPVATLELLDRIVAGGTLPMGVGRFRRALLGDDRAGADQPVDEDDDGERGKARSALASLERDYDELIADLARILRPPPRAAWPIVLHAVEARCDHHFDRADWDAARAALLAHPDPVVRLTTAARITNTGRDNLSTFDALHTPRRVKAFLAAELTRADRVAEVGAVLRELTIAPPAEIWQYHGEGYARADTRAVARATLAVLEARRPR